VSGQEGSFSLKGKSESSAHKKSMLNLILKENSVQRFGVSKIVFLFVFFERK